MLQTKEEIQTWLNEMKIEDYIIYENLTVNVQGDVYLMDKNLTEIPVQFGIVKGNFYCYNNLLTSLLGCPKEVFGSFSCSYNKLTSLKFAPEKVKKSFYCNNNLLTSLKFSPEKVKLGFNCSHNLLTSLEFAPQKIKGDFIFYSNQIIKINNDIWLKHFMKIENFRQQFQTQQLLDLNFLKNKYKEHFKDMKYSIDTIKQYKNEFKQFFKAGFITIEQIELDIWSK
jgi:hypothetical protein